VKCLGVVSLVGMVVAIDVADGVCLIALVGVAVGVEEVVVVALLQELNNVRQASKSVVHMTLV
jgi:hypothetical protein